VRGEEVGGDEGVVRLLGIARLLVDDCGERGDLVLGDRADGLPQGLVVLAGPEQVEVGIRAHEPSSYSRVRFSRTS
jgi:hypothetical protein